MDALGIAYMIAGSQASIYYGEQRFTQDIDVVGRPSRLRKSVGASAEKEPAPRVDEWEEAALDLAIPQSLLRRADQVIQ
jgi:hypothetical protein